MASDATNESKPDVITFLAAEKAVTVIFTTQRERNQRRRKRDKPRAVGWFHFGSDKETVALVDMMMDQDDRASRLKSILCQVFLRGQDGQSSQRRVKLKVVSEIALNSLKAEGEDASSPLLVASSAPHVALCHMLQQVIKAGRRKAGRRKASRSQ